MVENQRVTVVVLLERPNPVVEFGSVPNGKRKPAMLEFTAEIVTGTQRHLTNAVVVCVLHGVGRIPILLACDERQQEVFVPISPRVTRSRSAWTASSWSDAHSFSSLSIDVDANRFWMR